MQDDVTPNETFEDADGVSRVARPPYAPPADPPRPIPVPDGKTPEERVFGLPTSTGPQPDEPDEAQGPSPEEAPIVSEPVRTGFSAPAPTAEEDVDGNVQ